MLGFGFRESTVSMIATCAPSQDPSKRTRSIAFNYPIAGPQFRWSWVGRGKLQNFMVTSTVAGSAFAG